MSLKQPEAGVMVHTKISALEAEIEDSDKSNTKLDYTVNARPARHGARTKPPTK